MGEAEVRVLLRRLSTQAELVVPRLPAPITVRDPLDEHILALAVTGGADYLITGDNDLLVLAGDPRLDALRIVTVAEFLGVLEARANGEQANP